MSNVTEDAPTVKPPISDRIAKWPFLWVVSFAVIISGGLLKYLQQEISGKTTSHDIGHLIHIAPAGGFRAKAVAETATGFYHLAAYISAARGTTLVLEERVWGERYVCDSPKTLCVPTVPTAPGGFELPRIGAKP